MLLMFGWLRFRIFVFYCILFFMLIVSYKEERKKDVCIYCPIKYKSGEKKKINVPKRVVASWFSFGLGLGLLDFLSLDLSCVP